MTKWQKDVLNWSLFVLALLGSAALSLILATLIVTIGQALVGLMA